VAWGAYHGTGIVIWQVVQRLRRRGPQVTNAWARRALDAGSILLTFHFVMFGFALVHEPNLEAAMRAWGLVLFWWL
jgi:D-alanyl-lipoteichoic acid acyltransferase DltB (MBOAT superfamily)